MRKPNAIVSQQQEAYLHGKVTLKIFFLLSLLPVLCTTLESKSLGEQFSCVHEVSGPVSYRSCQWLEIQSVGVTFQWFGYD